MVNNRPSAKNFTHADLLQKWTRATNVRLRLMRTRNLLGHLMAVAKQDPTVTRRVSIRKRKQPRLKQYELK
jgi:laminin alpha 3/5